MNTIKRLWYPAGMTIAFIGLIVLASYTLATNDISPTAGTIRLGLALVLGGFGMCLFAGIFLIWRLALTGKSPLDL